MPILKRTDADIYYEVHGNGPPFLFFSETAADGEIWKKYQIPEFSRDYKVITFDYRGTGRSSKPQIKYTTAMFADDAAAIMDHLNLDQAIVCGHSMGGRVAQLLALDHPGKVKKLILASSGAAHPGMTGIPLKMCKEMVERGYERYVREHTIEVGWTDTYLKEHRDRVEDYLKIRLANLAPLECYLRHVVARQEHDTSGRLNDIRVPTLILVGSDDHVSANDTSHRTSADFLVRNIPNAKLAVLPGACHNYFFTNPGAAHRVIREFLAES